MAIHAVMRLWSYVLLIIWTTHQCCILRVAGQDTPNCQDKACYPPFINLIQDLPNRTISTSSTCGTPPSVFELHLTSQGGEQYQQQTCDASDPDLAHPQTALYDATKVFFFSAPNLDSWWQSRNGAQDVELLLTLGDKFLFQGTRLAFRSLRPKSLIIEKSADFGINWSPLQYYAISCAETFSGVPVERATLSYSAICEERYVVGDLSTQVPNSDIQETQYNPAQLLGEEFSQKDVMDYFTVTNVRITLGLPGSAVQLRDYFAIADWLVSGQCLCFGHAEECKGEDGSDCVCQHNTAGLHCDRCKPLFNNRPWQAAVGLSADNVCQDCGCNGHAASCVYDAVKEYGVCQDCTENTAGDKCEHCNDNFFRNPLTDPANNDTCVDLMAPYPCSQYCWPCMCNDNGTVAGSVCNETDGSCACKVNVQNLLCDECKDTFYNLDILNPAGCQQCDCDPIGSLGSTNFCNKGTGQCICKTNVEGNRCDTCMTGSYSLDANNPDGCSLCNCSDGASLSGQCDATTGTCTCRPNIARRACNETMPGFYVPKLDQLTLEAELAFADKVVSIEERPSSADTARHTGRGFLTVSPNTIVTFADVVVPSTQNYELVLRYESTGIFQSVRIELTQQSPVPYECSGQSLPGTTISLVSDVQTAGVGDVQQFGAACLNAAGVYNVSVVIGLSSLGPSTSILLDSLVLLPVLNDLNVFASAMTSNLTREVMTSCWMAAVSLDRIVRESGDCVMYEFSLMAEVYNGAIACSCNNGGTLLGTLCDSYSGQCQCLDGVTSQSCDYCQAYYYGYSTQAGCTACGCDINGALRQACDDLSGTCECHQNVIGNKCDACMPEHYGLYTGTGCVPCTCSSNYSLDNACADSGQCNCKPGIGGQDCTECAAGFYQMTTDGCTYCDCNAVGSTQSGCDSNGNCLCLEGTVGDKCDVCAEGFYGFGPWSERGCTQCYCSSHSTQCTSALSWFRGQVVSSWSLLDFDAIAPRWTGVNGTDYSVDINEVPIFDLSNPRLILELSTPSNSTDFFFVSPDIYHGDFRTAYGQNLSFTLSQSSDQDPSVNPEGDVFIEGMYVDELLVASLPFVPYADGNETEYNLKLHESYWRKGSPQGDQPTAEYVMQALTGIQSIRIRAKYNTVPGESVFLHSVMLDYATQGDSGIMEDTADFVENCTCPPQYTGSFCEQCAPGYRRSSLARGPFSDCVPCDCNGHSDLPCDLDTGVCQGCSHNTGGDFCQLCLDGYRGDATGGTPGDCQPCLCPGPPDSVNSFAAVCDAVGVCANCTIGHSGDSCETCINGFYGVPTDPMANGGQCVPCFCNLSPPECDTITGQCLACQGNTTGQTCDVCDFGSWGMIDNCQECLCDSMGSYGNCSQTTGVCDCYPNVIGDQCAECAMNTWGIASGSGCTLCDCHPVGTVNQQTRCDLVTGQCECKPRVTGQKCDQCAQGYWNIDQECIPCECSLEGTAPSTCNALDGRCTCDLVTGQCGCKVPTIAGRTCDRCGRVEEDGSEIVSEVFVGSFPNCEPCPECFQNWRKAFQDMADVFTQQQMTLEALLANYDGMTAMEVDTMLNFIRRNLTSAEQAIELGTREVVDLEDVEAGYRQISMEIANFTALVAAIEAKQAVLATSTDQVTSFSGNVIVGDNTVRNAAQLGGELSALVTSLMSQFQLANGTWFTIQELNAAIEASYQHVQQLIRDVDGLLQDIERSAMERQSAETILNDNSRDAEYTTNAERLAAIKIIQADYPVASTFQDVQVAQTVAQGANVTAEVTLAGVEAVQRQASAQAYQSEVARYNTTNAETAGSMAQSAAMTYKDVALSTKANMTSYYIQVLDTYTALQEAESRTINARDIAFAVQGMTVRPSSEIQTLVELINAASLSDTDVENLRVESMNKLTRAEQTKRTAGEAQMEAETAGAQVQNLEYDLTEATRVREETSQRLQEIDGNITAITTTASQVQAQAQEGYTSGQQTSSSIMSILQGVRNTEQCFSAKRNQAEDAANRAGSAFGQASTAQQVFDSISQDDETTDMLLAAAKVQSSADATAVQTSSDNANQLRDDINYVQQIADLDALMTQYMTQRTQMQQLNSSLEGLETSLDAIMANLEGAEGGDLKCKT
ncbi:laminin subunit alpha-2-like isoform X1 [Asterias amurensis]|uniref:laminin subunit alpha-2-like isoform X1 n=1 Tax=Asterias amurensis TaxID=7602 RepID=UPI003AB24939